MLTITPTEQHSGAELSVVDLALPLDDALSSASAVPSSTPSPSSFRNQTLTPDQHIAFSRRLGELERHVRTDRCLQVS